MSDAPRLEEVEVCLQQLQALLDQLALAAPA